MKSTYIVLVLCHNEVQYIKSFTALSEAVTRAILLANEWYRQDGIKSFGLNNLTTVDEMRDYYGSEAYLHSGDAANVCIEECDWV